MVDLKASPLMIRPTGGMSLPIWRDRIAAEIESARARSDAATARVSAEELMLAADLAQVLFMIEEADTMIDYIDRIALPNLATTSETAVAAYQSGMSGATMIAETRAMTVGMQVRRLDVLRSRETAVSELFLLIGAAAPADSPQLAFNNR
jgi:outer membrane protein TolC